MTDTPSSSGIADVATRVIGWQDGGQPSALARVIAVTGMSSRWPDQALAATDDETVGSVLGGAADSTLLPLLRRVLASGHAEQLDLEVGDAEAVAAGLACGGRARVLGQPSETVPRAAWEALAAREPVCLVTELDGAHTTTVHGVEALTGHSASVPAPVRTLFAKGTSQTAEVRLDDGRVLVSVSWPTCRLVVLGEGQLATSLDELGRLLGWEQQTLPDDDAQAAVKIVRALGQGDAVVVLSHDVEASGLVLAQALASGVGYVGALGSRHTQGKRREWLLHHGVDDTAVDVVRGPAGLDVGARTPAQIAVAITAEILAVRSGASATPLRDRPGPVNR